MLLCRKRGLKNAILIANAIDAEAGQNLLSLFCNILFKKYFPKTALLVGHSKQL